MKAVRGWGKGSYANWILASAKGCDKSARVGVGLTSRLICGCCALKVRMGFGCRARMPS